MDKVYRYVLHNNPCVATDAFSNEIFICFVFPSVQQSSFYGFAGMLPRRFTQAVMTGESMDTIFLYI